MKKRLPKLKSDEEADALISRDLSDYIHSGNFHHSHLEFAPKNKLISLRLSDELLSIIKKIAKKRRIPYQRFMREALELAIKKYI